MGLLPDGVKSTGLPVVGKTCVEPVAKWNSTLVVLFGACPLSDQEPPMSSVAAMFRRAPASKVTVLPDGTTMSPRMV